MRTETQGHAQGTGAVPKPYPQDLSGDVSYPVFFQCVPFGVLHKVCDGASPTELHDQLQGRQDTL